MKKSSILFVALLFASMCKAVDGDLDASFNTGGTLPGTTTLDIAGGADDVFRGAVWHAGLIAAGRSSAAENVIVVKYNVDGSLNTSFNSTGFTPGVVVFDGVDSSLTLFLEDAAGSFDDIDGAPNMVAVQPTDGKIIVVGADLATFASFGIIRLNVDGTPDTTFGGTGKVSVNITAEDDVASTVLLLPDGKILVAGTSNFSGAGPGDFTVVRLNSDGSLDTTFGTAGIATRVLAAVGAGPHRVHDMALQGDGKIILCGQQQVGGVSDIILVRFNSDGTLDTTFGTGTPGEATIVNGGNEEVARQMVIKTDGKIFVVGDDSVDGGRALVAQFNADGTIDTTFAAGFILLSTLAPFGALDSIFTVALEPDGKILIAGGDNPGGAGDLTVARLNAVGNTMDTSFGPAGTGKVTTSLSATGDVARAILLQPDGNIIVVGSASADGLLAVARYHNNHESTTSNVAQLKYQNLFSK